MPKEFNVFISHARSDATVALALKQCIEDDFNSLAVFMSSDGESIAAGEWFKQVKAALRDAKVVVLVCGPETVRRPWLAFEAGAAWLAKGKSLALMVHGGLKPSELPSPYNHLQAVAVGRPGLEWMYRQLVDQFDRIKRMPSADRLDRAAALLENALSKP